jgi:hypothetical protein
LVALVAQWWPESSSGPSPDRKRTLAGCAHTAQGTPAASDDTVLVAWRAGRESG